MNVAEYVECILMIHIAAIGDVFANKASIIVVIPNTKTNVRSMRKGNDEQRNIIPWKADR